MVWYLCGWHFVNANNGDLLQAGTWVYESEVVLFHSMIFIKLTVSYSTRTKKLGTQFLFFERLISAQLYFSDSSF